MKKTTLALSGTLIAAAALLTATPAPALPLPSPAANWLYLTVTDGDVGSRDIRGTLLTCDPPKGHARAAMACSQLAAVQGDVDRIPPGDVFCPMIYAPVKVSARGEWNGRQIDYSHTFANSCDLEARTGQVFALVDRDSSVPGLPR
ncbi:SSI family serine proteinase inhibitor [Streptomyces sp. NPDC003631]|uniref:Subtilisin inhibitor domain-containing protein n=1 Tax=Streptomyces lannensis TaxID=766498 RepID=A0ABP7JKW2_9ACTN|nr:SSI family serine proteinase inhibitor [Streptomyces sp. WAC07094]